MSRFTTPQAELVRVAEQFGLQVVSVLKRTRAAWPLACQRIRRPLSVRHDFECLGQVRLPRSPYWAYRGSQFFPNLVGAPEADAEQRAVSEFYFAFAFQFARKPAMTSQAAAFPPLHRAATSVADAASSCEACVPEAADGASLARSPAGNGTHEGQRALTSAQPRTAAAAARNRGGAGGNDPPKGAHSRSGSSPQPPLAESYIAREPFGNELLAFKAAGFVLFRLSEAGAPRLLVAKA